MRVVVDTNVLISALLSLRGLPALLLGHWHRGRFELITASEQLDELKRATRYSKIRGRLHPGVAGRLINDLAEFATQVEDLPEVSVSRDPWDNYLLSIAQGSEAEWLVTGDKRDLLALGRHGKTKIAAVRDFLDQL